MGSQIVAKTTEDILGFLWNDNKQVIDKLVSKSPSIILYRFRDEDTPYVEKMYDNLKSSCVVYPYLEHNELMASLETEGFIHVDREVYRTIDIFAWLAILLANILNLLISFILLFNKNAHNSKIPQRIVDFAVSDDDVIGAFVKVNWKQLQEYMLPYKVGDIQLPSLQNPVCSLESITFAEDAENFYLYENQSLIAGFKKNKGYAQALFVKLLLEKQRDFSNDPRNKVEDTDIIAYIKQSLPEDKADLAYKIYSLSDAQRRINDKLQGKSNTKISQKRNQNKSKSSIQITRETKNLTSYFWITRK